MLFNISYTIYVFTILSMIKYCNGQCGFNEHVIASYCSVTDLKVYESIPLSNNNDNKWATAAAQGGANFLVDSFGAVGAIPGPASGLIKLAISNLFGAFGKSQGNVNQDLKTAQLFENSIEAEFNKLQGCIDEKVFAALSADDEYTIITYLETLEEFNTTIKDIDDAENYIENFQGFVRMFRFDVAKNLRTEDLSATQFAQYLPVFDSWLVIYDPIISAYLMFLHECETNPNYIDVVSECEDYRTVLELVNDKDIPRFREWINDAFGLIDDNLYTGLMERFDLDNRYIHGSDGYVSNPKDGVWPIRWVHFGVYDRPVVPYVGTYVGAFPDTIGSSDDWLTCYTNNWNGRYHFGQKHIAIVYLEFIVQQTQNAQDEIFLVVKKLLNILMTNVVTMRTVN